jgi:hypothetical protein
MVLESDGTGRKRGRDASPPSDATSASAQARRGRAAATRMSGTRTPGLEADEDRLLQQRPAKRFRGDTRVIPVPPDALEEDNEPVPESPLKLLPEDQLAQCLSYLGGVEDRFALQATSTQFRALSNSDGMRKNVQVGGDRQTGLHGIIQEHDTPETAAQSLDPFVRAGNLEAIYMYALILFGLPLESLRSWFVVGV